jgi:formylglycine-generating enzyme required for sulfatase activity
MQSTHSSPFVRLVAFVLAVSAPIAAQWTQVSTTLTPPPRSNAAAAFDVHRGMTVLFGGYDGTIMPRGDTWEWNGTAWAPSVPAVRPAPRWGHCMAFDVRRRCVVLFGGFDGWSLRDDTWEWDGLIWLPRTLAVRPPARAFGSMAYDGVRGVCVLFGGQDAAQAGRDDTWEYDGLAWTQRMPATLPAARYRAAMAWDETRRETLLFGGGDGATVRGDLWAWNGTAWSQRNFTSGPSPRWDAALAFDGNCGRAVLVGGSDATWAVSEAGSWSWDGVAWSQQSTSSPTARHAASVVHDAQRGRFVAFGGRLGTGAFAQETRELAPSCSRTMSQLAPFVVGQTSSVRYDYPGVAGNQHFCWTLVTPRQAGAQPVPIPGFTTIGTTRVDLLNVLLDPAVLLDGSGVLVTPVAIPNSASVAGALIDVQSVDLDFATLALRWASNDVEATISPTAPPVASFTAGPPSGPAPLTVQFTDTSTQYPTSWQWDFNNDGIVDSTIQNPIWTFPGNGVFNVRLVAANILGSGTVVSNAAVIVGPTQAPIASFTTGPRYGPSPLVVQFADTSTNQPFLWQWDFDGDGVTDSNQQNPTWTFHGMGFYSIRLTVANFIGQGTINRPNFVYVGIGPDPQLHMVPIAPGTFQMGSASGQIYEQPVHSVTISQMFWLGMHEVTQGQYQSIMGSNPSSFQGANVPNALNRPVESVNWTNALAYCAALTSIEQAAGRVPAGYHFRLPTEAEWEYCCRAGTSTDWNTGTSLSTSQANIAGSLASSAFTLGQTAAVGSYAPNAFGLHDMHGNVWEWCLDSYSLYAAGAITDPFVTGGVGRVVRGGGFPTSNSAQVCRSSNRTQLIPAAQIWDVGFRVVLAPILVP